MDEREIAELEKHLGRHLTPEEKRLLRYTDKTSLPAPLHPDVPKHKKAAQSE